MYTGRSLLTLISVLIAFAVLSSCSLFSGSTEVSVVFPPFPDSWEGFSDLIEFRLVFPDGEGGSVCIDGLSPGAPVKITIPGLRNLPVLGYPVFRDSGIQGGGMRPSGGIYPGALMNKSDFKLTWEEGFLAECIFIVFSNSCWGEAINTDRLGRLIALSSSGDPWALNQRKLLRPLLFGRFYGGFVGLSQAYSLLIPVKYLDWVSGDSFMLPLHYGEEAEEELRMELYPGFHRFIAPDGSAWIDINIDEDGWGLVEIPGGDSFSGLW